MLFSAYRLCRVKSHELAGNEVLVARVARHSSGSFGDQAREESAWARDHGIMVASGSLESVVPGQIELAGILAGRATRVSPMA